MDTIQYNTPTGTLNTVVTSATFTEDQQVFIWKNTDNQLVVGINNSLQKDAHGQLGVNWEAMPVTDSSSTPVGSIMYFAKQTPPAGWLICNGAAISKTTYADLYSIIGNTYGSSSTTFNLPDLRGNFVRGWDNGRGRDAGRTFGTEQEDAIRNITGLFPTVPTNQGPRSYTGPFASTGEVLGERVGVLGSNGWAVLQTKFDASRVVPTADEIRPKNIALLPIIKY